MSRHCNIPYLHDISLLAETRLPAYDIPIGTFPDDAGNVLFVEHIRRIFKIKGPLNKSYLDTAGMDTSDNWRYGRTTVTPRMRAGRAVRRVLELL